MHSGCMSTGPGFGQLTMLRSIQEGGHTTIDQLAEPQQQQQAVLEEDLLYIHSRKRRGHSLRP
jgi:hypothetical protein